MIQVNTFRKFVILLLLPLLPACASTGGYISGQVLDADTREPIEGAHVIINWDGDRLTPYDATSDCFSVDITQSDAEGYFSFSPWVQADGIIPIVDIRESLYVYKSGYEEYSLPRGQQRVGVRLLKNVVGAKTDAKERMEYLLQVLGRADCGDIAKKRDKFLPFYKDLYQDALQHKRGKNVEEIFTRITYTLVLYWKDTSDSDASISDKESGYYFKEHIEQYLQ